MNRRQLSKAMRGLPVTRMRPCTLTAFMPTSRIVSIIPGIDFSAPERTETNSGARASPRRRSIACSSQPMPATSPLRIAFIAVSSPATTPAQRLVGRTKAGGTGKRSAREASKLGRLRADLGGEDSER